MENNINNIKCITLNIRSINSYKKQLYLKDILLKKNIDIALIQETHLCDENELAHLESNFQNFKTFFPLSTKKAKGVGILIRNSLNIQSNSIEIINNDRLIILKLRICYRIKYNNSK